MQDAANKIKKAFRTFSVLKKRNLWFSLGLDDDGRQRDSMGGKMCSTRTNGSIETYESVNSNGTRYTNTSNRNSNINTDNSMRSSNDINNGTGRLNGRSLSSTSPTAMGSNSSGNNNNSSSTFVSRKERLLSPSSSKQPNINSNTNADANADVPSSKYFNTRALKGMASKFLYGKGKPSSSAHDAPALPTTDACSFKASSTSTSTKPNSRGLTVKTNISSSRNNSIGNSNNNGNGNDDNNNYYNIASDESIVSTKNSKSPRNRPAAATHTSSWNSSTDSNVTAKSSKSTAGSLARSGVGSSSLPVSSVSPKSRGGTVKEAPKNKNISTVGKYTQNTSSRMGSEKSTVSAASTSTSSASAVSPKGSSKVSASVAAGSGIGGQRGGLGVGISNNGSNSSYRNMSSSSSSSGRNTSPKVNTVHQNKQELNIELKERQKENQRNLLRSRKEHALRIKEDSFCLVTQRAYCLIAAEGDHSSLFQVRYHIAKYSTVHYVICILRLPLFTSFSVPFFFITAIPL